MPHDKLFIIGETISLNCSSNGNPKPGISWKLNSTSVVNSTKYTFYDSVLSFKIDNYDDGGNYTCTASNEFNNKSKIMSSSIFLNVQEEDNEKTANVCLGCSCSCTLIEICSKGDESAIPVCSLNVWKVISFVFIALTLFFGMTVSCLVFSSKIRGRQMKNGVKLRYV